MPFILVAFVYAAAVLVDLQGKGVIPDNQLAKSTLPIEQPVAKAK